MPLGTVLVTGGTGQLGSALVRALIERGVSPRCLVRDPDRAGLLEGVDVELLRGDVTDPESLRAPMKGVESVFHLAGLVSYDAAMAERMAQVNVEGTQHVLDAAAAAEASRVVITSSIAALGAVADPEGIGDETTAFNWGPGAPGYLRSKHDAEQVALNETRVGCVAVNPGITFGARDLQKNAGRIALQLAAGAVPFSPPGSTTVASLPDVIDGHIAAMERGRPGERYVLGGTTLPFLELHQRVAAVLGVPGPTRALPQWQLKTFAAIEPWLAKLSGRSPRITPPLAIVSCANRRFSSKKAIDELGYRISPMERGIRDCVEWYARVGELVWSPGEARH